ncbi:MAG: molybdate ABC transporter permease subunit [Reichenbachiella sp.]
MSLSASEIDAIIISLKVAILCTVFSIVPALTLGYILARFTFYGKTLLESIIHLPLVMPPVTTGYILLIALGSQSSIGSFLNDLLGIKIAFTFPAAVLAAMAVSFPLFVRSTRTAMEMVNPGLEEASRTLGLTRLKTIIRITIPLSLPGIISGAILAFARSLGEFGATITFAGNIEGSTQTLAGAIYTHMQIPGQEDATFRLVMLSALISFIAMALSEYIIRKMRRA